MPNAGVVPSQSLSDTLSYDHNSWWPEIPEAGFSNSNNGLDPSEYSNIWSSLNDPLNPNGFHQLSEIAQAAGSENFQDFPTGIIQGLEGYGSGLEIFNQQPSVLSTKEKKAFPQTPPSVLHPTDLSSPALVPSSSFHRSRCFATPITSAFPSKAFPSTPDGTLEFTISPEPRLNQAFSARVESHLGLRRVLSTGRPEIICAHGDLKVPARSRKGCWTCRGRKVKCDEVHPKCGHCVRLKLECDYTRKFTYKDDSPAKELESITDRSGNPDPYGFPGNEWRPGDGPHIIPAFRFAECVRDADREMLAAQHKPGSFFVVATYQTFANAARKISPGIPTCYYTVGLSDRFPPRDIPVSVTIREFRRTDPGALPSALAER